MLSSARNAIAQIDVLSAKTTQYKKDKLNELKQQLIDIESASDFDPQRFIKLAAFCNACLEDAQFTAKTISLFGLLPSRSERVIRYLQDAFPENIMATCMNQLLVGIQLLKDDEINADFHRLKELISYRDYVNAKIVCGNLFSKLTLYTEYKPNKLIDFILDSLSAKIASQIQLTHKKYYSSLRIPFLEIRPSQKVYCLDEIIALIRAKKDGETMSFTYAIDLRGNVMFSIGAGTSFHYNLCQGHAVHGAGELYLKKVADQIRVTVINNKSGLYCPDTEFLIPMQDWLHARGLNAADALLKDEKEDLLDSVMETKLTLR